MKTRIKNDSVARDRPIEVMDNMPICYCCYRVNGQRSLLCGVSHTDFYMTFTKKTDRFASAIFVIIEKCLMRCNGKYQEAFTRAT